MIYMFLAEGFEEVEALCPLDLCRRAGIAVTTVGIGGATVKGSHGIAVVADMTEAEFTVSVNVAEADGVILPGGMPGTENLYASRTVTDAVKVANRAEKLVAAICAAPSVPGRLGILAGRRAVCFPGFEKMLAGAVCGGGRVVRDGHIVTGVGMGAALEFGLKIVEYFTAADTAKILASGILAPDCVTSSLNNDNIK